MLLLLQEVQLKAQTRCSNSASCDRCIKDVIKNAKADDGVFLRRIWACMHALRGLVNQRHLVKRPRQRFTVGRTSGKAEMECQGTPETLCTPLAATHMARNINFHSFGLSLAGSALTSLALSCRLSIHLPKLTAVGHCLEDSHCCTCHRTLQYPLIAQPTICNTAPAGRQLVQLLVSLILAALLHLPGLPGLRLRR